MPLIRLTVPDHIPADQVHALAHCAHAALVHCCDVPENDRFIVINRIPAQAMLLDPHFPNVCRSPDACLVETTLLAGRSATQKAHFFQRTVEAATAVGFRADDILLALTENTAADWSLGLGQSYAVVKSH